MSACCRCGQDVSSRAGVVIAAPHTMPLPHCARGALSLLPGCPSQPYRLQEFQEAARCLEFPPVQRDRVANLLLAYKSRWVGKMMGLLADRFASVLHSMPCRTCVPTPAHGAKPRLCFLPTVAGMAAA